jgi:chorismate dehydratase
MVKLGAVSYLNAGPLVWGLEKEEGYQLLRDTPARVAGCLHSGGVDLGMIPSIEYAFGRYAIVPGIGIGSRGAVQSVLLFHTRPLEDVRRVALDTSSRTSAALVRILLRERRGRDPEYVPMAPVLPDMLARPTPLSSSATPPSTTRTRRLRAWTSERSGPGSPGCRSSTPSWRVRRRG